MLALEEVPKPVPRDDEVLLEIHAATVGTWDCECRSFTFPAWLWLPLRIAIGVRRPRRRLLGQGPAGEIESVGERVTRFQRADQVFASTGLDFGVHAESKCKSSDGSIALEPANVTFERAATLPTGGDNALHVLRMAKVRPGECALVNGAGGTSASSRVQIAENLGAEVTAVASADELDMLHAIGADHVIDDTREDLTSSGRSYDVILDVVFGNSFSGCVRSLAPNGRYLLANLGLLSMIRAVWTSSTTDEMVSFAFARARPEGLTDLEELVEAGRRPAAPPSASRPPRSTSAYPSPMRASLLVLSLTLAVPSARADELLPLDLRVARGTAAGAVTLRWSGSDPVFEIHRSTDPSVARLPASEIAETLAREFEDSPPAASVTFYVVGRRTPSVPEEITIELLRPNDDPVGRPLPVAGHWNTGRPSSGRVGWDPDYVMDAVDAGYFAIPGVYLRRPTASREPESYYERLTRARALGIPFAVVFTQWDRPFTDDPRYADLPPADNPNVIDATDGSTIVPKSDPEGPVERWQEVGAEWSRLAAVGEMQAFYPDPPLVLWVNNFEQPRLLWGEAETSWRFVDDHGTATTDEEKRGIVGEGWIERDGALFASLRAELTPQWQAVSIPVCYTAFGRGKYGSWSGWDRKSLHQPGRFSPWPLVVNGSPSYYVFADPSVHEETDYQANAPQAVASNWQFMLDEAFRDAPDLFWEFSLYDGGTQRHNWYRYVQHQIYDEARYKGFVRYGLWMARPRLLREFRLSSHDRAPYESYWFALLDAVREVHEDPDLRRFWRKGRLVLDDAHPHHWQSHLVPGYTDAEVGRNFILDADANPPRPWSATTEIAVWALALELGEAPNREWLLFAYAPLADRDGTTITIPGHGPVIVDVPRGAGAFWIFREVRRGSLHGDRETRPAPTGARARHAGEAAAGRRPVGRFRTPSVQAPPRRGRAASNGRACRAATVRGSSGPTRRW